MIFTRLARGQRSISTFALAVALAAGGTFAATALEAPAHAQKKSKEKPAKATYSKEFVAAYQPLQAELEAEGADANAAKAKAPAVLALAVSDDEKLAAGQLAYSVGLKTEDAALQRQGLDLMLASNKLEGQRLATVNFAIGQMAQNAGEYAAARARYDAAMAAGYDADDVQGNIAETYFAEKNAAAGVAVFDKAIAAKVAAGQPVPENWLKRGLAMAYGASLPAQSTNYSLMLVKNHPTPDSWSDAINIQRILVDYEDQELLDLLRLANRIGVLRSERDYIDYISVADARRLPAEVSRVIAAGVSGGHLDAKNGFVAEARRVADGRISADRADLASLAAQARASGGTATATLATGDAYLAHGEPAKAEELYTLAMTKPGVDTQRALTRLGIAQFDQGKYADAQATFAKVTGPRQPIASLWAVYAAQKGGGAAAPASQS